MSSIDPVAAGNVLHQFRLLARVGSAVWRAEDVRNGKTVAVKILTKQLPRDATRREALVRDVRLNAAIFHPFLVPVTEIAVAGDVLLMIMEFVEGQGIGSRVNGKPLARNEFFALSYQISEVLRFLHEKSRKHGNLNADSVMVTSSGQIRLCGLNASNILPRPDTASTTYQQRASDPRSVAYMAPEQIASQTVDISSDLFSFGLVMYEMATGRAAYQGATGAEIARKIVEEQPPSPKSLNPAIDNAVMLVLGRCLFKDPFRRFKDAKAVGDEIARQDPDARLLAAEASARVTTVAPAVPQVARQAILFVADVANYEELAILDANGAAKIAARMQQLLGEAVYLFDGTVIDPFGPRMIAELPNVEAALEAGRKGEFDFSNEEEGTNPIEVRLLLHAGEVTVSEGTVTGEPIERAMAALQQLQPQILFITEEFVKAGRPNVRLRDAGGKGGLKLFTIVPAEPVPIEITTLELDAIAAAEEADARAAAEAEAEIRRKKRSRALLLGSIAAVVLLAILFVGWRMLSGSAAGRDAVAVRSRGPLPASAEHPRRIALEPFAVEGSDPVLTGRANAIRVTSIEVLRAFPELKIADPAADSMLFSAQVRAGGAGPELLPTAGKATGTSLLIPDVATGVQSVVQWVLQQVHLPQRPAFSSAAAVNSLADCLTIADPVKSEAALRAALAADPSFLPAQIVAMNFFEAKGNDRDALAAAKQVAQLDPKNLDATRHIARESLRVGDVREAFSAYNRILVKKPNDLETLNVVARYAAGVGDAARFNAALSRLRSAPPNLVAAHDPDIMLAAGRMEAAIDQYYDVEVKVPNNPMLSLKIGRISVLRRSMPIADIELKKLERSDPNYGFHLLKAYVAAQQSNRASAEAELKQAQAASAAGDDFYTSAAEVYAILADASQVVSSLEAAAERREPTISYVLMNHLFDYVQSDPRYQKVRARLAAQQEEMRAALAQVNLS
jgi:tetratricopeptide (TPR) repeat protein